MLPKLVITDIDGVWTDGGMYYTADGDVMKRFSVKDGWGVIFLRELGIPVAIMTGENTQIVQKRADKLKIKYCYLGVKDKVAQARELCRELDISLDEVAFIGDDFFGRQRFVTDRQLAHVDQTAAFFHQFRQTVDVTCRTMVMNRNNRIHIFFTKGTDYVVGTFLHFCIRTLHGVQLDTTTVTTGIY